MIGSDLRTLRVNAGLSQVELAAKLNLSQSMISRIEKGFATTTDVVEAWTLACGGTIRIDSLLGQVPELRYLFRILPNLKDADLRRLAMIASGMPLASESFKEGIASAFFSLTPAESQLIFQQALRAAQEE